MASQKSKFLLVTTTDCDPEHADEFNDWYNNTHVPDVMACPGFISSRRYEAVYGEPRFIAIYEIEDEGALKTPEVQKIRGFGKMFPYVRNFHERIYRLIFEHEK